MEGLITSQLRSCEIPTWTHLPNSRSEPLFNPNGSVTREFILRWSEILTKLEITEAEVNNEVVAHAATVEL